MDQNQEMTDREIVDVRDIAHEIFRDADSRMDNIGKIISRGGLALIFYHTLSQLLDRDNINVGYWLLTSWLFMFGFSPQIVNHRYFYLVRGYSLQNESYRKLAVFFLMGGLYMLLCLWLINITPQEADLARMARQAIKSVALIIVQ